MKLRLICSIGCPLSIVDSMAYAVDSRLVVLISAEGFPEVNGHDRRWLILP